MMGSHMCDIYFYINKSACYNEWRFYFSFAKFISSATAFAVTSGATTKRNQRPNLYLCPFRTLCVSVWMRQVYYHGSRDALVVGPLLGRLGVTCAFLARLTVAPKRRFQASASTPIFL